MVLVFPPAVRSTEPPLGLARLTGFLRRSGRKVLALDLNQLALDRLLGGEGLPEAGLGTWERGALRRRARNLEALRQNEAYRPSSFDRYKRAVLDLNRALKALSAPYGAEAGLADYREASRSPLRRADLLEAAASWEGSVYLPLFEEVVGGALEKDGEGILGLSLNFLGQALPAFSLIGLVRKRWPRLRIILGGGLLSSWIAQGSLREDEDFGGLVDRLVPGRGEEGLARWLELPAGEGEGPPDFEDFRDLSYVAPKGILPFNLSYGCPWRRCSFCPERAEKSRYRGLRRETALEELGGLADRHRPGLLHLTDNEIAPLYLRALSGAGLGIPWYGFARFSPLLADPAFCRSLAASGCVMLQLGLESGDQAVLDALDKGTDIAVIEAALGALGEAGIGVYLYLLFGTPAEDRDAALRTRDFVARHAPRIAYINAAIFNLPVASPEAATLRSRDFYEGDLALYREFEHPAGWDRPRLRRFLAEDFAASPEIGAILARTPPVFTSNHAPFFILGEREEKKRGPLARPPDALASGTI